MYKTPASPETVLRIFSALANDTAAAGGVSIINARRVSFSCPAHAFWKAWRSTESQGLGLLASFAAQYAVELDTVCYAYESGPADDRRVHIRYRDVV